MRRLGGALDRGVLTDRVIQSGVHVSRDVVPQPGTHIQATALQDVARADPMDSLYRLKRLVTTVLLTVLLCGVAWAALLYFRQESMMYYPRGYSESDLEYARKRTRFLEYRVGEAKQTAFYLPPLEAGEAGPRPRRLWLFFGGNGARALDWLSLIDSLPAAADSGFLLIDYPGYGLCEGKPSPKTIAEAIDGALRAYLESAGAPGNGDKLAGAAVLGHSLGAAAALTAAEKYGMRRIVLMSPFTSMRDMAATVVGRPLSRFLRHQYDNRAPLERILAREEKGEGKLEVTIIHGEDDRIIPVTMGKTLAGMAPDRIQWHPVPGADHNDLLSHAFPLLKDVVK